MKILLLASIVLLFSGCKSLEGSYLGGMLNVSTIGGEKPNNSAGIATNGDINSYNWKNMLPVYMYYNEAFDAPDYIDKYISIFYPDEWKKVKDDEFEIAKSREKHLEEMRLIRSSFEQKDTFVSKIRLQVGKYDFKNQAFPLLSGNKYISLDDLVVTTGLPSARGYLVNDTLPFPKKFEVYFIKADKEKMPLSYISINPDDANKFIKQRKTKYGNVDRSIFAIVTFRIVGKKDQQSNNQYIAEIKKVHYEM